MRKLIGFLTKHYFLSLCFSKFYALLSHFRSIPWRIKTFPHAHVAITAKIIGWRSINLGKNCVISSGTWINVSDRRIREHHHVVIGENSFIGRNNFFSVGNKITLGPYCLTASNCSFIGSSHVISDPFKPYISTGVTNNWSIVVGANCFFGYEASIIGNVTIGHGCVIGAHCKVMHDIPPFSVVVGNPGKVIKRFDFRVNEWVRVKEYDGADELLPDEKHYINELRSKSKGKYPFLPISVSNSLFGDIV